MHKRLRSTAELDEDEWEETLGEQAAPLRRSTRKKKKPAAPQQQQPKKKKKRMAVNVGDSFIDSETEEENTVEKVVGGRVWTNKRDEPWSYQYVKKKVRASQPESLRALLAKNPHNYLARKGKKIWVRGSLVGQRGRAVQVRIENRIRKTNNYNVTEVRNHSKKHVLKMRDLLEGLDRAGDPRPEHEMEIYERGREMLPVKVEAK